MHDEPTLGSQARPDPPALESPHLEPASTPRGRAVPDPSLIPPGVCSIVRRAAMRGTALALSVERPG
jgi:hypothetical protein